MNCSPSKNRLSITTLHYIQKGYKTIEDIEEK